MIIKLNKFKIAMPWLIFLFFFGTVLLFCSSFFIDKEFSLQTIVNHFRDIKMYWCLLHSFVTTVFLFYFLSFWMYLINKTANRKMMD
ncbi:hypothetical protein B0A81_21440 [Flavobacterium plurextorum]|uniref:PepSY-associated TM region n=1 Tax=Flavobacterium plurextorum TaxID=1114867 RepID=A0ABX4CPN4_9FLAO|nr:hypothetical protein B0A81_21440 [Flavobacterium plurextorum]